MEKTEIVDKVKTPSTISSKTNNNNKLVTDFVSFFVQLSLIETITSSHMTTVKQHSVKKNTITIYCHQTSGQKIFYHKIIQQLI